MSVKVEGLTKIYGQQIAVDHISFDIKSGEVVGFLGPNGAGKSTTMKMICGFIEANQGSVSVNGLSPINDSLEYKRQIGYLPENNPLYYDMYVKEYLGFVGQIYKLPKLNNRVSEMIELTGLGREQHKKINQLSKGYKQRVGLAQAMIHNPQVLILDEPTSGLDPNQLEDIRNLIINLGKEKTVILSTHIMQEVEAMCQRLLIINKGKLVADDRLSQVKNQSKKQHHVLLKIKGKLAENIQAEYIRFENLEDGYIQASSSHFSNNLAEEIYKMCVQNKYTLLHLEQKTGSLEDVFKQLTK